MRILKIRRKNIWKGVNEVRKRESLRVSSVRNSMGEELTRENDIEGTLRVFCPAAEW